jgi:hypothetical protein
MKKLLLTLISLTSFASISMAQCVFLGMPDNCADLDASTFIIGTPYTLCPTLWGAEYSQVDNMTVGCTYLVETCGTSYPSNLTISVGGTNFGFGPSGGCGDDASFFWVAPATYDFDFQINEAPGCGNNYGPATITITLVSCPVSPEIDIEGNTTSIPDGDVTPILGDDTDFGNVVISATATNTFTIQNEGTSDLILSGGPNFVSISGDPGFSIVSQPSGTIAAGSSSNFQIRFSANCGNPLSQSAIVSVSSNDTDESPYTFTVNANITGVDTDSDGSFDPCDPDDDNDGIADGSDPDDTDFNICGDSDGDGCDDCSVTNDGYGALSDSDPANDGADVDCDGICDATDVTDGASLFRGNMLTFDGADDYVSIGDNAELNFGKTDDFTVEAWIKTGAASTAMQIISKYEGDLFSARGWGFQVSGSSLAFFMAGASLFDFMISVPTGTPIVKDGLWHHVAVSYDGSNTVTGCTFYIDGVPYAGIDGGGTVTTVSGTVTNSEFATIGAYDGTISGVGEYWEGSLDEVRVWDDVRSQTEIRENRHLTLSGQCFGDLDGYWKFNETSGTTAFDLSGNGNLGTHMGGVAIVSSEASVGGGIATIHNATATATNYFSPSLYAGHSSNLNFATTTPGGEIVVTYINEMPVGGMPAGAFGEISMDHWIVDNYGPTNSGLDGTIRFSYNDGGITTTDLSTYKLDKRGSNAITPWITNNTMADAASTTPGANYIEFNFIDAFSMFFPSSTVSPLPVELVNFEAVRFKENVVLNWETVSELNNEGFYVLHSVDVENWTIIDFLDGVGTSNDLNEYELIHRYPAIGINYYLLKQIDFDGESTLSEVRAVNFNGVRGISLIPNPNDGLFNVKIASDLLANSAEIEIIDVTGVVVYKETFSTKESKSHMINASTLSGGLYILRVTSGSIVMTERVVIQ